MVAIIKRSGNEAVDLNPSFTDMKLTEHGSDWLWAAFAVFSLLAVVHGGLFSLANIRKQNVRKALYVAPLVTNAVMAYAYFTYAANLGWTDIQAEFNHVTVGDSSETPGTRQIFYSRFVGWFLAWPFALFIINFAKSAEDFTFNSWTDVLHTVSSLFVKVLATETFVLGLLIGSLIRSTYKWGYFTFATVAQLFAMYLVVHDNIRGASIGGALMLAFIIVTWVLYPVAWGLSEGGNVIQPDSEAVFYGILDLIMFSFVPTILTAISISKVDETAGSLFNFNFHKHHEKVEPRASGDTAVSATEGEGEAEAQV